MKRRPRAGYLRLFLFASIVATILGGPTLTSDAQRRAKIRISGLVNGAPAAGLTIYYFGCTD